MKRPISVSGILAITSAMLLADGYIWFRSGANITTDSDQSGSPRSTPSIGIGSSPVAPLPGWTDGPGLPDHFSSSKSAIVFPPLDVTDTDITATVRARPLLPSSTSMPLGLSDMFAGDPESTPSQTATATATATATPTPPPTP